MEVRYAARGRGRRPMFSHGPEPGRRRRREEAAGAAAAAERLPRARAPDEPSSPKRKHFFLASHYCDESLSSEGLLTISHDQCNFLVLEPMDKDDMNLLDDGEISELSLSGSQMTTLGEDPYDTSEVSGLADYALLNDTYSIHLSDTDSKMKEHFTYLSSETDLEMQKGDLFFDILKSQSKDDSSGLEDMCKNLEGDYKEIIGSDIQKHDVDEDSQQEIHMTEEQDYSGYHLDFDEIKTLCTPNSELIELGNSDYEIKCASDPGENHVTKLEGGTFFSYESTHICAPEDMPMVPKLHDYLSLAEYHGQKYQRCQEQETGFMSHSLFDSLVQISGSMEDGGITYHPASQLVSSLEKAQKTLKANVLSDKRRSQIIENKNACGTVDEKNDVLKNAENPNLFPRASGVSWQPSKCLQNSTTCIFDNHSCYQFIQSTPEPDLDFPVTVPKVPVKDSFLREENGLTNVTSDDPANKTQLINIESKCPKPLRDANRNCLVTVNQTIDASSDFRACFTTSRATSARSSVTSRSSNTEITMMNKTRPNEWPNEKQRSVACNTDWSCLQDDVDKEFLLQGTLPKGLERSFPVENSKANDNLLFKDYLESKNKFDIKDLNKNSESLFQLSKEVEKNFSSICCQKTLQRAIKAELLLLKAHYLMCHQHCWKIYRLVMEEKEGFTRNFASDFAKTDLGSTLLSLFGDLKFKYLSMREKIIKGIPLDEMPPLSVESKLSSFFSTFIPSQLMKEDSHIFSGTNSDLDISGSYHADPSATNLKRGLSQASHASEKCHPKQEISPKRDSRKTRDLNVGIRNLKLDDEDCRKCQEISETWFDAKENLTGIDCSEIPRSQTEQDKRSPEFPREKIAEASRREPSKSYLIHVGSLCPSVSETDLMSHFQKYQVSEVSICNSSHNYRYASLVFKKANKARMAVEEMNGKEINGKSVNVRLVKTPLENALPLSFRSEESRFPLSSLEKMVESKGSGPTVAPLKFTPPVLRPPGPEQENVYFSVDQKGSRKTFKQNKPIKLLPESPFSYIPPNSLNLGSFTKLLKKLEDLHPDISRDTIIDALQEVRTNNKGFLSGLSLTTIVEMTTSVLRNSAFKKEEKNHRETPLEHV